MNRKYDVTSWLGPRNKAEIKCVKCGKLFKRKSKAAKQCPACRHKLAPARQLANASTIMVAKKSTLRPPKS